MKLIKIRVISGFRYVFSTIVLILTDTIWPMPPCINATISIIKKLQHNFPKMRGGGSKAVWNFSKKSSDLVAGFFPMHLSLYLSLNQPLCIFICICLCICQDQERKVGENSENPTFSLAYLPPLNPVSPLNPLSPNSSLKPLKTPENP